MVDFNRDNTLPRDIVDEMKESYLNYSMSVIVSRALPDVRDGLKPVHRRILYGMSELGSSWNRPYKKSARIVGDVLGKYHPHGDSSVYDALVRMAQDFSMRYELVDGQGNFGSIDGDNAAAMRYTESRMTKLSSEMLKDLDKDTVNWEPNFDETLKEPSVLPSSVPALLINGSEGIAVGMATKIPPHNLMEIVNGIVALIENTDISTEGLMNHIKGPDFPTAGLIMGMDGLKDAYETGRGKIKMRARAHIESNKKVLIVVPTTSLVTQMYNDFADYSAQSDWDVERNCHKVFAGREKLNDKRVVISTWQSIYKLPKTYFNEFSMVVGDECHLFKAKSLTNIMSKLEECPYRFGTTGTLDGTQTHKLVIEGLFGPILKVTTTKAPSFFKTFEAAINPCISSLISLLTKILRA